MYSEDNKIQLYIKNIKVAEKLENIWRLNSIVLNNIRVKEDSKQIFKNYL